jgi:hypothetical protein
MMLEVFNKQRRRIGVLQKAFQIREEEKINSVNKFSFSLPYDDSKNELSKARKA